TTVQGGVEAESLGVVEILVSRQPAVNRLPQQGGLGVLSVLPGATVLQHTGSGVGQVEDVVELAVGQQSGIAGDLGAEEAEPETAVELGSQGVGLAVTHEDRPAFRQEKVRNPGILGVLAQLSCRKR